MNPEERTNKLRLLLEQEHERARKKRKIMMLAWNFFSAIACHSSISSLVTDRIYSKEGQDYVRRLLDPNLPNQAYNCRKIYRMSQTVFLQFCDLLRKEGVVRDGNNITVEEKLAIFLVTVGQNQRYGVTRERFHCSGYTISHVFNEMLNAIVGLSGKLLVKHSTSTHRRISNDANVFPYFKDCIGAIDGTHIKATIYGEETTPFRNRKGELSQKVLAACNFDMEFVYVLAGWEGSATDARVFQDAISRPNGLKVPSGKFYLVDADFPNRPEFICPLRGVRYHLSDYDMSRLPTNATENFNYRHSQLRTVIEHTFGVVKHRFAILCGYMPFPFETQVKIVHACFLLHNFIRKADREDLLEDLQDELEEFEDIDDAQTYEATNWEVERATATGLTQQQKNQVADNMRNEMMLSMWAKCNV